jgi:hypothetical protein
MLICKIHITANAIRKIARNTLVLYCAFQPSTELTSCSRWQRLILEKRDQLSCTDCSQWTNNQQTSVVFTFPVSEREWFLFLRKLETTESAQKQSTHLGGFIDQNPESDSIYHKSDAGHCLISSDMCYEWIPSPIGMRGMSDRPRPPSASPCVKCGSARTTSVGHTQSILCDVTETIKTT